MNAPTLEFLPGSLVAARGREWIVLPESDTQTLRLRPLGGGERDETLIYLPLERQPVQPAIFPCPSVTQARNHSATQRAHGGDTAELVEARRQLQELEAALGTLRADEVSRRSQQSSRVDAVKAMTAAVATRLLGAAGHARFVPGHEVRPFEVARGGEAYQVLEVLLGDVVCLLDSAVSEASNHPGFLVHDCPREADMSELLYREFFLTAAEAAEQLGKGGEVPFQFIVTTTSAPPPALQEGRVVVLELEPAVEEKLLFRRELQPLLSGFE